MKWNLMLVSVCALAIACGSPPATDPESRAELPQPQVQVDQKSPLYEQLHSGIFQADSAVKKIGDALDLAHDIQSKAGPDLGEALKDMVATLDDDGESLASLTGEPPSENEVHADERKFSTKRSELINAISDTLQDIREQEGIAASLSEDGPPPIKKQCAKLDNVLNQAIDDLLGALAALGGKEEGSEDSPDTADTNQRPPAGY